VAAIAVGCLAGVYLAAITSTHVALRGGSTYWAGMVPGHTVGLGPITSVGQAQIGPTPGFSRVLWATRPGGEVAAGFQVHNAGPVPVTLLSLALRTFRPGVINALAPVGAQLGPGFGQMTPFHPVALGPGDSVAVGLTERVVCDRTVRGDARLVQARGGFAWLGDAISPVVMRYRALGVTMSQTLAIAGPVLVVLPYRSCL
jgi:hypothetical protein